MDSSSVKLLQELTEPLQQQLVERLAHLASTFQQWQRAASSETIEAGGSLGWLGETHMGLLMLEKHEKDHETWEISGEFKC